MIAGGEFVSPEPPHASRDFFAAGLRSHPLTHPMTQGKLFPEGGPLSLSDYLTATDHAASRSRSTMIVLLIACLLIFAGLLNSLQHSWMQERVHALRRPEAEYACRKIGPPPTEQNFKEWGVETLEKARELRNEQYLRFYSEVAEQYAKSTFSVGVPVLGASVDVNDLGLVGGAGLLFILVVCTFYLSRELENLKIAFKASTNSEQAKQFYSLLAMRQVFTIPHSPFRPRRKYLILVPSVMYVLPPIVHGAVTAHDLLTSSIGQELGDTHTLFVLLSESAVFVLIVILSCLAWHRQRQLDKEWELQWQKIEPTTPVALDPV